MIELIEIIRAMIPLCYIRTGDDYICRGCGARTYIVHEPGKNTLSAEHGLHCPVAQGEEQLKRLTTQ